MRGTQTKGAETNCGPALGKRLSIIFVAAAKVKADTDCRALPARDWLLTRPW